VTAPETRLSLYTRYLRNVIWRHCLRGPKQEPATYIHIAQQANRYFYLGLRFLSSPTRHCAVLSRKPWIVGPSTYGKRMDAYARLAYAHPFAQFARCTPCDTAGKMFVHDGRGAPLEAGDWGKTVRIDYDIASAPPTDGAWTVMPYPMHPLIYAAGHDGDRHRLRHADRAVRLFFAGNVDAHAYTSSSSMQAIRSRFEMMDRASVISSLLEGLDGRAQRIRDRGAWQSLLAAGQARQTVLAIDSSFRIPLDDWLETLSRCDVFLAPPGVFMPLCHNAVEAMAVGCIPLTNYADWFTPRLMHMRNCIEFTDEDDLVEKAKMVLKMEPERLAAMRANVIDYYDRFLDPDRFLDRLVAHPARTLTVFMITERRSIWERVGEDSVLLADRTPSAASHSPRKPAESSPALSASTNQR